MSKQASSAAIHLCHPRAPIAGGSAQERQRDYAETLHREGPVLIQSELARIRPILTEQDTLFTRICQAIDVLLGRSHVYVDRRHRP